MTSELASAFWKQSKQCKGFLGAVNADKFDAGCHR
jgi:hypothetical protein